MKYWILEILKVFAVPAILILIIIVVLTRFIDITNQEISNVVLGVMLGVILGFSADLIKRGFDDLTKMQRFKKNIIKTFRRRRRRYLSTTMALGMVT